MSRRKPWRSVTCVEAAGSSVYADLLAFALWHCPAKPVQWRMRRERLLDLQGLFAMLKLEDAPEDEIHLGGLPIAPDDTVPPDEIWLMHGVGVPFKICHLAPVVMP